MSDPAAPSKLDIHELKNVLKAIDHLVVKVEGRLKDGGQLEDLVDVLQSFVTDPVYADAAKEYKEIFPEVKDLDMPEGIEVAIILISGLPRYIQAMKSSVAAV